MNIHYWKKIFIEIATRAIRQSHFEYQVISFPQRNIQVEDLKKMNSGIGIELVPEETVRDYIVNQLLQMGFWKKIEIDGKERSYWTDREVRFKIGGENKYVDLLVERYDYTGDELNAYAPALIELKRLNTRQIDLKAKPPFKDGQSTSHQISEIDKDIEKLKFIRENIRDKKVTNLEISKNNAIIAILTWGIIEETEKNEIFKKFELPNNWSEIRYFPTEWNDEYKVSRWCIVVLTEIDSAKFENII